MSSKEDDGGYWAVTPEVVGELEPSQVRWFSQEAGEKTPVPLCGADSLRVEVAFRIWKELPMPQRCRSVVGASVEAAKAGSEGLLPVLGGLYHAHLPSLSISPIYWEEPPKILLRGTWFRGPDHLVPFTGKEATSGRPIADLLEEQHLATFMGQKIPSGDSAFLDPKAKKMTLASLKISAKEEVLWHSPIDVKYRWNDMRSKITRRLVNAGSGTEMLRRGYPELAHLSDAPKPIGHILFVVHGIGQMASSQDVLELTKKVQKHVDDVSGKNFKEAETRTLLFPVQWRKGLALDGGRVESITLRTHAYYRRLINHSLMDIMYYLSPRFNEEIKDSVRAAITEIYQRFTKLHPDFEKREGRVSIMAHSLGGVIAYDILNSAPKEEKDEDGSGSGMTSPRRPLPFPVHCLFTVGSPVGVFISMRGEAFKPRIGDSTRVYNVFYEQDFVGFRLEPLMAAAFQWLQPVPVPPAEKGLHKWSQAQSEPKLLKPKEKSKEEAALVENPSRNSSALALIEETSAALGPESEEVAEEAVEDPVESQSLRSQIWDGSKTPSPPPLEELVSQMPSHVSDVVGDLEARGFSAEERVDYALRGEQSWLSINLYNAVFNAHFNYWSSKDLAGFILSRLHPQIVRKAEEDYAASGKAKKK